MAIPFFILSPILFLLYEMIWPKVVNYCRIKLRWGVNDIGNLHDYFLLGSICTAFLCGCNFLYTFLFCLCHGVDPNVGLELEYSGGLTQVCHLGFGIAGAMLAVFSKKTRPSGFLKWLRSISPIYFYTLNSAGVLIILQLGQFNGHPVMAEIAAGLILVFVAPHFLVVMVEYDYGRDLQQENQLTDDEFYEYLFNEGRWGCERSAFFKRGLWNYNFVYWVYKYGWMDVRKDRPWVHFIIHIDYSKKEISYHDQQGRCSSCGDDSHGFGKTVAPEDIPDRLLDDLIRILEMQEENCGIRTWFYPFDCEVMARGVIGLNQRCLMLMSSYVPGLPCSSGGYCNLCHLLYYTGSCSVD